MAKEQFAVAEMVLNMVLGKTGGSRVDYFPQKPGFPFDTPYEQAFPRATPESQGISSDLFAALLRELDASRETEMHHFMALRHGKVICECNFAPYPKGLWHITHSMCKSITGMAIGMLVEEGKLKLDENIYDAVDPGLAAKMHKAIAVIQFKLEGQLIRRHKEFHMENRCLLHRIDPKKGMITLPDGKEYPLTDTYFPTIDWKKPYELTTEEKDVMERLDSAFRNCEKLQNHVRLLLDKGGLYKTYNGNLLFHGSIPLNEDGSLKEVQIYGKTYKGKELYDVLETYVRRAFFSVNEDEKRKGRDIMWYIWAAPNSPLFGKDKMTTFERYFIKDKETHKETKNAYYHLLENEDVVDDLLREFELDPEKGHIINGHVPVHQSEGESPVKCNGKVLVIDGGFSRPYQKVTGIAGYTLVYNSYGLILSAHEPFTSAEEAVAKEQDIVSNRVAVHYNNKRTLVGDTDTGTALKERISELIQLLEAYRKGIIKEKK